MPPTATNLSPTDGVLLLPSDEYEGVHHKAIPVRVIRVEGVYAPGGTGPVGVTVAIGDIR